MRRRGLIYGLVVLVVLAVIIALGPRVPVDTTITFDPAAIGDDPAAYLARTEGAVAGIRDDLDKEIIWANPLIQDRTPVSVVYIHGFSASKGETRPLADKVAEALGANLFYTRLTGHGQDGAAMATASVNAWMNDYAEAIAIARALGDRVVVIAASTGASLAVVSALQPGASEGVAALALISPNFGAKAGGSELLTWPWGGLLARLIVGKERGFEPYNDLHRTFWTHRYPTSALLPMAALVDLANAAPVEQAKIPALFILSDSDQVVRADLTRAVAARWGAPQELVPIDDTDDPDNHVLAGDALSPSTTDFLADRIAVWVKAILD